MKRSIIPFFATIFMLSLCNTAFAADIETSYRAVLQNAGSNYDAASYMVYDFGGDGVKELILSGGNKADRMFVIFSYNVNAAVEIDRSIDADSSELMADAAGNLYRVYGRMGGYTIERVLYNNGIFSLEEIYNHYEKDFEKGLAMLEEQERKMGLSPLEWAEPTDDRLLTGLSAPSSGNITAGWRQGAGGWWYQDADGSYPASTWREIDGKWYYFDKNGWMLSSTVTPDGYWVDADGTWNGNREMAFSIQYGTPTDTGTGAAQYQDYVSAVNGEYGYNHSIIGGSEVYSSIYAKYKLTCISDNAILLECTDYNRFTGEETVYPPCIAVRQEDGSYHVPEESKKGFGDRFRLNTSTREMIFESGEDFFYIFSKF